MVLYILNSETSDVAKLYGWHTILHFFIITRLKIFFYVLRKKILNRTHGYSKRWNIFARELEIILATRGIRIEALPGKIAIFPEKARHLAQSLSEAGSFPILNADEMADLIRKFHLSNAEVLHLNTAILATSIEKTLIGHVGREVALTIADATFPQILAAFRQADDDANDPDARRGDIFLTQDNTNNDVLNAAWRSFDGGEMALHLGLNATSHKEQIDNIRQACQLFEQALKELETVEAHIRYTQGVQNWRVEIQRCLAIARAHLPVSDL